MKCYINVTLLATYVTKIYTLIIRIYAGNDTVTGPLQCLNVV